MTVADRLEARILVDLETGCHNWQGALTPKGYGQISVGGRRKMAHRAAYEASVGDIPPGLQIDHLCRNRACCNPDHLEAVTPAENNARSDSPSARHARQTHCIHGHEFTPENTVSVARGRKCRTCRRALDVARSRRKATMPATGDRTHCPKGHAYDSENTAIRKNGARTCRACDRMRRRKDCRSQSEGGAPATTPVNAEVQS